MPTNVRHKMVVWRCACTNEHDIPCARATWVAEHKHENATLEEDEWTNDHPWVGRKVTKQFGEDMYRGTITGWMPNSKTEWELWKIRYDDEDEEDLEIIELLDILDKGTQPKKQQGTHKSQITQDNKRTAVTNTHRKHKKTQATRYRPQSPCHTK